jgi:MFS transporter, PAT family, beta-lactamase induction signal transducer AmpG
VNEPPATGPQRSPWLWVPSLYFIQGVPFVVVMSVAVIMFKRLGVGNKEVALYTSWLYAPYAFKPLWSPLVQRIGTRRGWVVAMQLVVGAGLGCAALAISADDFVRLTLATLTLVAFSSATHDVAADGFYLLAMTGHQQAWFVGIRSTAYRVAMLAGQGLLVMLAGTLESATGLPPLSISAETVASPGEAITFDPTAAPTVEDGGEQRVVISAEDITISLNGRESPEVSSLIEQVRDWNSEHGFYEAEETEAEAASSKSAWRIALEDFIKDGFGPAQPAETDDLSGDIAIVWMRLARPIPQDQCQVIQFGHSAGDMSFKVAEGERFAVTAANWEHPFASVIRVDRTLSRPSRATFDVRSGNLAFAWSATFLLIAALMLLFCLYHFVVLPKPAGDVVSVTEAGQVSFTGFVVPFIEFFRKPRILVILGFLLLYRLPESQLVKLAMPFLLDPREVGGLSLSTGEVGFVYGTIGMIMLTLGGIVGGFVAARDGLRRWLIPMALIIHLPNLAFLYLAYASPDSLWTITGAVAVEQFGYGFGFTGYLLYCIYVSRGKYETVHYALCTGCMALGMMIPGAWSGWLEELIGYQHFFIWIMLCAIPSLAVTLLVDVDPEFGKKTDEPAQNETAE